MVRPIAALLGCLLVLCGVDRAEAHPLHSSFTEIRRDRASGLIELSIRLFADDFAAKLAELHRAAPPGESVQVTARRYFERSVVLASQSGAPVPITWCGMRTDGALTWICARSAGRTPSGRLRLRNALMFDRFADQISIVRWMPGSRARTLVLSVRAPEALLD